MTDWTRALDMIERQLHRQEAALRGTTDVPPIIRFEAPEDPMTDEEQVRAIALMQRNDSMITETIERMKRSRRANATPYSR